MFYDPPPPPPPAALAPVEAGGKAHRRPPRRPSDTPPPTVPVPPPVVAPELRDTLPPGLPDNFRDLPAVTQWYLLQEAEKHRPWPAPVPAPKPDSSVTKPLPGLPSYDPPSAPFSPPGSPVPVSPPVPVPSGPGPAWHRLSNESGVEGFGVLGADGRIHGITARRYLPGSGAALPAAPPAAACGPNGCPVPARRGWFPRRGSR